MSFVTTRPEALTAAAGKLQAVGEALTAQNAAASAPTTGVAPAAADEVSALQATQFASYGSLYQQISAQATRIHEMFVNTLGASAGSYDAAEATNAATSGSSQAGLSGLLDMLTGNGSYGLLSSAASNSGIVGAMQLSNFGSAASVMTGLGSSGLLAPGALTSSELPGAAAAAGGVGGATLTGAAAPAGAAGVGAAPVMAGTGHASAVGGLSVPPSWGAMAGTEPSPTPATLAGAGWTTAAAPHNAPVSTVPAGMPSVASAGRGGLGFGTPRYGVKPAVLPRPAVV